MRAGSVVQTGVLLKVIGYRMGRSDRSIARSVYRMDRSDRRQQHKAMLQSLVIIVEQNVLVSGRGRASFYQMRRKGHSSHQPAGDPQSKSSSRRIFSAQMLITSYWQARLRDPRLREGAGREISFGPPGSALLFSPLVPRRQVFFAGGIKMRDAVIAVFAGKKQVRLFPG